MPARLVLGAFLTYLREGRSVCCPLVTLVIVDVDLDVIGVQLVIEIVSVVIVVGGVIGFFDGVGAPTPHEHPPGGAECEAPRG